MNKCFTVFVFIAIIFVKEISSLASRIKIVNNGYENIFIALPSNIETNLRPKLISGLKNLLWHSSDILLTATKGRASFRSAMFLIPDSWGDIETWLRDRDNATILEETGALHQRDDADIVVWNPSEDFHPYALHHKGCGEQALRIYLPLQFILTGKSTERSIEFTRLWSEFRYGVFPENGFENDVKFPLSYLVPGENVSRSTDCINIPFRIPQDCDATMNCNSTVSPSIMDNHYKNGTVFCEGHSGLGQIHLADPPTKQNLLCSEEGTFIAVLRSPDFIHGKNAAPRRQRPKDIKFKYIKESRLMRAFVAIDISSQMSLKNRYVVTKNAFARFVIQDLPNGSDLNLLTFGDHGSPTLLSSSVKIGNKESRIQYLESQPLPEVPTEEDISCPECALDFILEQLMNDSDVSPHVILITTQLYINDSIYENLIESLKKTQSRLHVFFIGDDCLPNRNKQRSLFCLCNETDNHFISMEDDVMRNMYSAFSGVTQATTKDTLISQNYLIDLDEENIFHPINIDSDLFSSITITVTGPAFDELPLRYDSTVLRLPDKSVVKPQKQELLPAWIFYIPNPETGIYTLKTWRKRKATSPILVSVTGSPSEVEDSISVKLWVENLKSQLSPSPIRIFGEVRKGVYPIINATVTADVYHPNNDGVTKLILIDDGLGSIDITKHDGIYSGVFTNFTSAGFYNVRIKVSGGIDDVTAILKGPSSICCGSRFPSVDSSTTETFHAESNLATFQVISVPDTDIYPPARVTDLRVTRSYDLLFVLEWTAVGSDYAAGVASTYEIKLFRDRSMIRNRFFDSGLEIYNETIETTEDATYGTTLYHVLKFTSPLDTGLYYAGIRAVDESGNCGEPSNAASIWLESGTSGKHIIDCANSPVALGLNAGQNLIPTLSFVFTFVIYLILL